jgi:hypothetical protein
MLELENTNLKTIEAMRDHVSVTSALNLPYQRQSLQVSEPLSPKVGTPTFSSTARAAQTQGSSLTVSSQQYLQQQSASRSAQAQQQRTQQMPQPPSAQQQQIRDRKDGRLTTGATSEQQSHGLHVANVVMMGSTTLYTGPAAGAGQQPTASTNSNNNQRNRGAEDLSLRRPSYGQPEDNMNEMTAFELSSGNEYYSGNNAGANRRPPASQQPRTTQQPHVGHRGGIADDDDGGEFSLLKLATLSPYMNEL